MPGVSHCPRNMVITVVMERAQLLDNNQALPFPPRAHGHSESREHPHGGKKQEFYVRVSDKHGKNMWCTIHMKMQQYFPLSYPDLRHVTAPFAPELRPRYDRQAPASLTAPASWSIDVRRGSAPQNAAP